jgi:phosphatidylglycerol:prolipoprotein diacylglycerol transferase
MPFAIPFPPLSPEIFSVDIGEFTFALRWYALAYIAGILIGWRIVVSLMSRLGLWATDPPMTAKQVEDLLTWVIIGIIAGGRLGYVVFYQPAYFLRNPLEIFAIWQGGMSFHGGMIGVVLAIVFYSSREKLPILSVADALAVATPPGLFFGRVANFINAELWGRSTSAPWGVIFPGPAAQDCGPDVPLPCARHPSQLYEAGLEGILLWAVLLVLVTRGGLKYPGRAVGTFLAGYGSARFFVELFRQPDAQFVSADNPLGYVVQFGSAGLTMGQILSIPMIAVGVWLFLRTRAT